jgi:D-glycero-alpha-D-manno-heptose-7-phosphate kinase
MAPPTAGLAERFFVVYTGHPHHSGMNNWSIIKRAVEKDRQVLQALHRLKEVAAAVETVCRQSSWDSLGELLREEYKARIQLAPEVLCDEIVRLKEMTDQAGAEALKICGAGGGGCVIVWCSPAKIEEVKISCQSAGFQILPARPVGRDPNQWK